MSSVVVSTSAALGRPFLFDAESEAEIGLLTTEAKKPASHACSSESVIASVYQSKIGNRQSAIPLTPASSLEARPAPEMVTSGIAELDALTGGLPRGCLTEICGTASSGRTSMMLAALASATRRAEYCALIDASDALDPQSVAASGIDLDRLLWVRCNDDTPKEKELLALASQLQPNWDLPPRFLVLKIKNGTSPSIVWSKCSAPQTCCWKVADSD